MELFKLKAGVNITNIAYNGGGPATQALLTGTVDVLSTALPGAQSQVAGRHDERHRADDDAALAGAARRADIQPNSAFRTITLVTEHFLLAPAGTPPDRRSSG